MEALKDADILRVLELYLSGLTHKEVVRKAQLDAFTVRRIVDAKRQLRTKAVLEKYPKWLAKNEHLLEKLHFRVSTKNADENVSEYEAKRLQRMRENQAALAALGLPKLAPKRVARTEPTKVALAREAARKNPRRSSRLSTVRERSQNGRSATPEASALALTRAEQSALFRYARRESRGLRSL